MPLSLSHWTPLNEMPGFEQGIIKSPLGMGHTTFVVMEE